MSIEAKHAYRFGFLKSEKWENFRLEALVKHGSGCFVCGKESIHNDVHHVFYPSRWSNTKTGHVIVLCRKHHRIVHLLMNRYPSCEKMRAANMVKMERAKFKTLLWRIGRYGFLKSVKHKQLTENDIDIKRFLKKCDKVRHLFDRLGSKE